MPKRKYDPIRLIPFNAKQHHMSAMKQLFGFLLILSTAHLSAQDLSAALTVVNPETPAACPDCTHMPDMYRDNCNGRKLADLVRDHLRYPQEARERKAEGTVHVGLEVNAEGRITHLRLMKKVDPALDAEALRLAEMLKADARPWKPALMGGRVVASEYVFKVPFVLNPPRLQQGVASPDADRR